MLARAHPQEVSDPGEVECPDCGAKGQDLEMWLGIDSGTWAYDEGECKVCGAEFRVVPIRCVVKKVE